MSKHGEHGQLQSTVLNHSQIIIKHSHVHPWLTMLTHSQCLNLKSIEIYRTTHCDKHYHNVT